MNNQKSYVNTFLINKLGINFYHLIFTKKKLTIKLSIIKNVKANKMLDFMLSKRVDLIHLTRKKKISLVNRLSL